MAGTVSLYKRSDVFSAKIAISSLKVPMGSSPALGDAHSPSRRELAEAAHMAV